MSVAPTEPTRELRAYLLLMTKFDLEAHGILLEDYYFDTARKTIATHLFFANLTLFQAPKKGAKTSLKQLLENPLRHITHALLVDALGNKEVEYMRCMTVDLADDLLKLDYVSQL